MTTLAPSSQAAIAAKVPCFVFDADLNVVCEPGGIAWPVAIVAELRVCVRRALAADAKTFTVFGDATTWRIVRVGKDARFLAVFPELPR